MAINYKDNKDKEIINLNSKIDNFKNAIEENNNTYESLIDKTTKSLEKIIEKTENISKSSIMLSKDILRNKFLKKRKKKFRKVKNFFL